MDLRLYDDGNNVAHLLALNKERLFLHNKEALLLKSLDLSRDSSDVPHITLNRGTVPANRRKSDKTLFFQVNLLFEYKRTCFFSTKVHILTTEALRARSTEDCKSARTPSAASIAAEMAGSRG